MPRAIALRSFDHNGPVRRGDVVEFDEITMKALRRSGLVSKDDTAEAPKPDPVAKTAAPPKAPKGGKKSVASPPKAPKGGKKSVASPAAPASPPTTVPASGPGSLPPPPPVV